MAWGEVNLMKQRQSFIRDWQDNKFSFAEICRRYEISRKTGYKWINRYQEDDPHSLENLNRAPKVQAGATNDHLVSRILDLKYRYLSWGPKKILATLRKNFPEMTWPSTTTIGNILDRHGLVMRRKYKHRFSKITSPLEEAKNSNDVWCMDFKGWSTTKDGLKFDPFTLSDQSSRYLLRCVKLPENNATHVWGVLEMAFREYGLPLFIRSDNGPPFATSSPGRLSRLSVKLIKAGVMPEWIEPGNPQQNGRHERMHRTMKAEGVFPNLLTLEEQKIKLHEFCEYFNFQRPHEAIGQVCPGSIYIASPRVWNGKLNPIEYSGEYQVGKVRECGKMCWKGNDIFISRALEGEYVGVKQNENDELEVYFGPIILGKFEDNELKFERNPARTKRINKGKV